jgi:Xaa-Pro aminopeptidase
MDNGAAMSIETEDELEGLRRAGHVVAVVLRELRRRVQPGVTRRSWTRWPGAWRALGAAAGLRRAVRDLHQRQR